MEAMNPAERAAWANGAEAERKRIIKLIAVLSDEWDDKNEQERVDACGFIIDAIKFSSR